MKRPARDFPDDLIARAKELFERKSGREMEDEEVIRHLHKLADLGLLMAKVCQQEREKLAGKEKTTVK